MKTTTYTITEAKAINANILTIEKLQRTSYLLNVTKQDLSDAQRDGDEEMIEIEKSEIERISKSIEVIKSNLTNDDILFSNQHKVYLIDGEGGRDRISIESI